MNLLQKLQARTEAARAATPEEVQEVFDAIVCQCLASADMGKDSVYVESSDIFSNLKKYEFRESSFDDAFTRAMARIIDSDVVVKTTGEEGLFDLVWAD